MSNKLGVFLAGGIAGAAIALLYAPRTGAETRVLVNDKINEVLGDAQCVAPGAANIQQVYQDVTDRGQEFYSQASSRVQEAADTIRPAFTQKNDELREKIEEARQRIATQVARNAEEAGTAAQETVEVPTEVTAPAPQPEAAPASAEQPAQEN